MSPYIIKAVFLYRLCRRRFRGIAEDAVADADVISLHAPLFKQCFSLFRSENLLRAVHPAGADTECGRSVHQIAEHKVTP